MVFLEGSGKKESHRESLSLLKEHLYGGGGGVSRDKGGEDILRKGQVEADVWALLLNWKGEANTLAKLCWWLKKVEPEWIKLNIWLRKLVFIL